MINHIDLFKLPIIKQWKGELVALLPILARVGNMPPQTY